MWTQFTSEVDGAVGDGRTQYASMFVTRAVVTVAALWLVRVLLRDNHRN